MSHRPESFKISPDLLVTRCETEIIDLLVDHKEMPQDFGKDHVRSFFNGNDFHLVIYFHQEQDRGFQMFVVNDFSLHVEELHLLRELFVQLIKQGYSPATLKKAHYRVDDLIHMARTLRAVMHGTDSLPNDQFPPGTFLNY